MSTTCRNPTWPLWALAFAPLSIVIAFFVGNVTDNKASILIIYPFVYVPLFSLLFSHIHVGGRAWRIVTWIAAATIILLIPASGLAVARNNQLKPVSPIEIKKYHYPYATEGEYEINGLDYQYPPEIRRDANVGPIVFMSSMQGDGRLELNGQSVYDIFGNGLSGTKTASDEITLRDSRGNVVTFQWSGSKPIIIASKSAGQSASVRGVTAKGKQIDDVRNLMLILAPLLAFIFLGFTIFAITKQIGAWPAYDAVLASIVLLIAACPISYASRFGFGGLSGDEKASGALGFACLVLPLLAGGLIDLSVRLIVLTQQINKPMSQGFPVVQAPEN